MSVRTPIRNEFHVAGMTCRHCALSVSEEVSGIDGVSSVDVELATGAVTVVAVRGDRPRRGRRGAVARGLRARGLTRRRRP